MWGCLPILQKPKTYKNYCIAHMALKQSWQAIYWLPLITFYRVAALCFSFFWWNRNNRRSHKRSNAIMVLIARDTKTKNAFFRAAIHKHSTLSTLFLPFLESPPVWSTTQLNTCVVSLVWLVALVAVCLCYSFWFNSHCAFSRRKTKEPENKAWGW